VGQSFKLTQYQAAGPLAAMVLLGDIGRRISKEPAR
jgi:hypothetical protein